VDAGASFMGSAGFAAGLNSYRRRRIIAVSAQHWQNNATAEGT
jgi:hypothetical protein